MDLSIDFGGTTYSFVIFNQNQIYYKSESIDIKQFKNYYELFNQISLQVYSVTEKVNILGIGCPGPLDASTGLILNTPNLKTLQYSLQSKKDSLILYHIFKLLQTSIDVTLLHFVGFK